MRNVHQTGILFILGAGAVLVLVVLAYIGMYVLDAKREKGIAFFSGALAAANVSEKVFVRSATYFMKNGVVTDDAGTLADAREQFDALRIAYAKTVARRSPIFGMSGTDPEELEKWVYALSDIRKALANKQE